MFGLNKYKKVSHSDGMIQFRVPKDWTEELEDDGNLVLWNESGISGTLRLTLLTAKKKNEISDNPALSLLGDKEPKAVVLENDNAYRYFASESEENGDPIKIFHYELANYIEPEYYRLALYSFTIYSAQENKKEIQKQLEVLDRELPITVFLSDVQDWEK